MSIQCETRWGAIPFPPEHQTSALVALHAVAKTAAAGSRRASSLAATTLAEALRVWGFEVNENPDTNRHVEILVMPESYQRIDVLALIALAPFVVDGAELHVWIEGTFYRWRFEDGKVFEDVGDVAYEDGDELTADRVTE